MKVAIITDQHIGCRKNSKLFHDYFLNFYQNIFFPYLERENITTIVDMGDTFDSRKGIDFSALSWAKKYYYDVLASMGVTIHTIVGNHTAYYKNSNHINAVDLLLREYDNVRVYADPTEILLGNLNTCIIPWICPANEEETLRLIKNTNSSMCMGHLELQGFKLSKTIYQETGLTADVFNKFTKVFSGHYHTRSDNGKVFYLGNPYQMFSHDENDPRGFTIFDTDTLEHSHVNNPYQLFHTLYYDDEEIDNYNYNFTLLENKIVRVIVKKKTNKTAYDSFVNTLYESNIAELKLIENFQINLTENDQKYESEDTLTLLNSYIDDYEIDMDKLKTKRLLHEIHMEAYTLI
jgi:hypothetical protein